MIQHFNYWRSTGQTLATKIQEQSNLINVEETARTLVEKEAEKYFSGIIHRSLMNIKIIEINTAPFSEFLNNATKNPDDVLQLFHEYSDKIGSSCPLKQCRNNEKFGGIFPPDQILRDWVDETVTRTMRNFQEKQQNQKEKS